MSLFRSKIGPEDRIAAACDKFLAARGWLVESMHGNAYQRGIPDRYLHHREFGARWIDYKNPKAYQFTKDQKKKWPEWDVRYGVGIWILTAATESEYAKLFAPPNWREYWRPARVTPAVDELLAELS